MSHAVYVLIDPRDNGIRYVGITHDVYERFKQHLHCKGANDNKHAWIKELKALNLMVIMRTVEEVDCFEKALEREQIWIQHFLGQGISLLNIMGVPAPKPEKEARERYASPTLPPGFVRYSSARFLSKLYFYDEHGELLCLSDAPAEKFVEFLSRYAEHDWLSEGSLESKFSPWNASGYRCQWINHLRIYGCDLEIYTKSGQQITDLIGHPFKSL